MNTDKDLMIVDTWFKKYKYATIPMLQKVYYQNQSQGYKIVARRLTQLAKSNFIKIFKDGDYNRNIYVYNDDKPKVPSEHRLIVLNLLAELKALGFTLLNFEVEREWVDRKYRSDAFISFGADYIGDQGEGKGKKYYFFVEVMTNDNHSSNRIDKYDAIYENHLDEVQQCITGKPKDYFPDVLLIADRHFGNLKLKHTNVLQINLNLDRLSSILL